MINEDLKPLLSSLLKLVDSLAKETANLIDERSYRSQPDSGEGVQARASEIRAAATKLTELANKVLSKTGQ